MNKKFIFIILCIFFFITIFLNSNDVSAVELDSNHFLLTYSTNKEKVLRNLPEEYYDPTTDYFTIREWDGLFAHVFKNAKTNAENGGTLVSSTTRPFTFYNRYDNGSSYAYEQYNNSIIVLDYNYSTDNWVYNRTTSSFKWDPLKIIYSPVSIGYKGSTGQLHGVLGYIGVRPYIANTNAQLQNLSVGEVSVVSFDCPSSLLSLSLYDNTNASSVFSQKLMDIKNLDDYSSRVDVDDPFSELAYNIPWNIFPEFEFIEGHEYELYLYFSSDVEPSTKTFTVTKTIKNTDILPTNTPNPPPEKDPNQSIIDSNKETQNAINNQTNKIEEQTEAIKENNKTNKGIFESIKEMLSYINPLSPNFFVYKLIELLIEGLKSLFVPSDNFFSDYFTEIQNFFRDRLGFLWTPFDIIIEVLNRILNINFYEPIIDIPEIKDPFTNTKLISSYSFNLNILLDNNTLKTVHDFYLIGVDVVIIVSLVNLAKRKIEEVFAN